MQQRFLILSLMFTKGSDAWRAHQAAKQALDAFDLAHPGVVVELYEQFEAYQQAKVK